MLLEKPGEMVLRHACIACKRIHCHEFVLLFRNGPQRFGNTCVRNLELLVKRSPLHIVTDGVFAHPVKDESGAWRIPGEVTLNNSGKLPADAVVKMAVFGPDGKKVAEGEQSLTVAPLKDGIAKISLSVDNPQLWSPESPVLYTVRTAVSQNGVRTDEAVTRLGSMPAVCPTIPHPGNLWPCATAWA